MRKYSLILFAFIPFILFAEFIDNMDYFFNGEIERYGYYDSRHKIPIYPPISFEKLKNSTISLVWEFYPDYNGDIAVYSRLYSVVEWYLPNIRIYVLPVVYYFYPQFVGYYSGMRPWNSVYADFTEAYGEYNFKTLNLWFGKKRNIYGSGIYDHLLFSGRATPMDQIGMKLKLNDNLSVEGFTANLSSVDTLFISSHFLNISFSFLKFSFGEAIIYHRKFPEWYYVNPFSLYYVIQYNRRGQYNDNILWYCDFNYKKNRWYIYGEFLIDDFQYDPSTPGPAKLAFLGGIEKFCDKGSIIVEFTRVNRWTYTHFVSDQIWVYNGIPIGSSIGIDSWRILLSFRYSFEMGKMLNSKLYYMEKGEGNFSDDINNIDNYPSGYPSGIVQKTVYGDIGFLWYAKKCKWELKGYAKYIKNWYNIIDNNKIDYGVSGSVEWEILQVTMP